MDKLPPSSLTWIDQLIHTAYVLERCASWEKILTAEEARALLLPAFRNLSTKRTDFPKIRKTLEYILHIVFGNSSDHPPVQHAVGIIWKICRIQIARQLETDIPLIREVDRQGLLDLCIRYDNNLPVDQLYQLCDIHEQMSFFLCLTPNLPAELFHQRPGYREEKQKLYVGLPQLLKPGDNLAFIYYGLLLHWPESVEPRGTAMEFWQAYWNITHPGETYDHGAVREALLGPYGYDSPEGVKLYLRLKLDEANENFRKRLPFPDRPRRLSFDPLQVLQRERNRWRICFFAIALDCNYVVITSLFPRMPWENTD
jgi:hypothetical protein